MRQLDCEPLKNKQTNKTTTKKLTPFTTENGCVSLAAGFWVTQLGEGDLVPKSVLGWGLRRVRRSQAWLLGTGPWSLQLCGGSGWLRCSRPSLGDPVDSGPGGACPRGEAPRGSPRGLRLSALGVYVLRLSASRGDVGNAGSGGAHVVPSLRWPHNQLPRSTPVTLRRRSAEASVGQLSEAGSRTPLFGMRLAKFGDGTSTRFLT